ncbi:MAG: hypothetical protein QM699_00210 [Amaricoccus sp.]|uniref:hypothetical protein n=1 Tax=Amaricoccus sp. TaxID=1872485 RepID=UPI0039E45CDA
MALTFGTICAVLLLIVFWVVRKMFDKRRGAETLPIKSNGARSCSSLLSGASTVIELACHPSLRSG